MMVAELVWGTPRAAFGHLTSTRENSPGNKTITKESTPRDGERQIPECLDPAMTDAVTLDFSAT